MMMFLAHHNPLLLLHKLMQTRIEIWPHKQLRNSSVICELCVTQPLDHIPQKCLHLQEASLISIRGTSEGGTQFEPNYTRL